MDPVQKMWRYLNDNTRASLGSTLMTLMYEYLVGKNITRTIHGMYEYRFHLCKGSIYNNGFFLKVLLFPVIHCNNFFTCTNLQ